MHEEAVTETAQHKPQGRLARFRWWVAAAVVVVVSGVLAFTLLSRSSAPPGLVAAQQAVSFPVYYPTKLPAGFSFDKTSVSYTKDVVLYSYLYDHGKRATISVQPHSANFSTDQFKPTLDFTSHIGRAYVVDLEDRSSAAIVGEKSWVLINAPNKMAADVLQNLINSLEPVRS